MHRKIRCRFLHTYIKSGFWAVVCLTIKKQPSANRWACNFVINITLLNENTCYAMFVISFELVVTVRMTNLLSFMRHADMGIKGLHTYKKKWWKPKRFKDLVCPEGKYCKTVCAVL